LNVLVLGGSRFVGLRTVEELLRRGHRVAVLNRGVSGTSLPVAVERLYADRRQPSQVESALAGRVFDAVIDTSCWWAESARQMADLLRDRTGRYVFVSTSGVYAPASKLPIREDFPLELRPVAANRPAGVGTYIREKVAAEEALGAAREAHGFPVTIVRPSMIFGPKEYQWARAPAIFARLEQGRPIPLRAGPDSYIQLVDVDDLARLLANALETAPAVGQVYNAALPEAVTAEYVIRCCAELGGTTPRWFQVQTDAAVRGTTTRRSADGAVEAIPRGQAVALGGTIPPLGGARTALLSIEKAQRELGDWQRATVESCLRACWEYYRDEVRGEVLFDFSAEDEWR
jgi:nucleoside-diphosphate-sugar epimerase